MPQILFILGHTHNVCFFDVLASMLEARGATVHFLSTEYSLERRAHAVRRRAPNVMHTRVPAHAPSAEAQGVSLEDVCRYFLDGADPEGCAQQVIDRADAIVRAYAVHFDRVRPDLVATWNGTIPRLRAGMKLAEARGIPTLYFEQGNFPGTLIADAKGVNWEGSMRDAALPGSFNRERIGKYLAAYHQRTGAPAKRWTLPASLFVDAALNFCARRDPFHPTLYFDDDKAVDLGRFARRLFGGMGPGVRRSAADELDDLPERFVFLPLQVHDDTQIVVHSPRVRTMTQLVAETLEALPDDMPLVVKSHPADEGRRGYREIEKRLAGRRHRFVRRAGTLELARRSACVVTVNSTVGLEALTYFRPVVVLGDAVYGGRGFTHDVTDLADFPRALREAMDAPPDPDAVLRFLDHYIFEYCRPGDPRHPDPRTLTPLVDDMLRLCGMQVGCMPAAGVATSVPVAAAVDDPLVSIVIPAYNGELFIGRTIRSVLRQTYTNWELIVVDDGSTDCTGDVVRSFDDERIRYLPRENRGAPAARNTGIKHARGEFIASLDQDDIWFPMKLEEEVRVLQKKPDVGLVYCNARIIDEDGRRIGQYRFTLARLPRGRCLDRLLIRCGVFVHSTVVYRRSVLTESGLYGENLPCSHDWDLYRRIAMHAEFHYIPRTLAAFRSHAGQASRMDEIAERCNLEVLRRAYANPEVRRRFTSRRLRQLHRQAMAVHHYNMGLRASRRGDAKTAVRAYVASIRSWVSDYRQFVRLLGSMMVVLPGLSKFLRRLSAR